MYLLSATLFYRHSMHLRQLDVKCTSAVYLSLPPGISHLLYRLKVRFSSRCLLAELSFNAYGTFVRRELILLCFWRDPAASLLHNLFCFLQLYISCLPQLDWCGSDLLFLTFPNLFPNCAFTLCIGSLYFWITLLHVQPHWLGSLRVFSPLSRFAPTELTRLFSASFHCFALPSF